ncbi:MAG: hypothetical protein QXG98_00420 [Candidatus Micrarchaeia archaeon]
MVLESRESRAIGLGALGALVLAYAFYSLYLMAQVPASSFPSIAARVAALIGSVALPAGIGLLLLFIGVSALLATLRSVPLFALAALAWLYAIYNLHALGSVAAVTDITPYATHVGIPVVAFIFIAVTAIFMADRERSARLKKLEEELASLRAALEEERAKRAEAEKRASPFLIKE